MIGMTELTKGRTRRCQVIDRSRTPSCAAAELVLVDRIVTGRQNSVDASQRKGAREVDHGMSGVRVDMGFSQGRQTDVVVAPHLSYLDEAAFFRLLPVSAARAVGV